MNSDITAVVNHSLWADITEIWEKAGKTAGPITPLPRVRGIEPATAPSASPPPTA